MIMLIVDYVDVHDCDGDGDDNAEPSYYFQVVNDVDLDASPFF